MPLRRPFLTAGQQIVKNMSSCRIKLFLLLFYQIKQNPEPPSANIIVLLVLINLIVLFGRLPSTMDAVSAAIFDGWRANHQKHK